MSGIQCGEKRKRRFGVGLEPHRELLAIGHDRGDVAVFGGDPFLSTGQSVDVDATIRAPLPAIEDDRHRPLAEQIIQADKRSEEHSSELQSLMRNSYAVFCLKKKKNITPNITYILRTLITHNTYKI